MIDESEQHSISDAKIVAALHKVDIQARIIAAMYDGDPGRILAQQLLNELRLSAELIKTNRTLFDIQEE